MADSWRRRIPGKVKRSTTAFTRFFWRRRGNRFVLVSSAIPGRLAQNTSGSTWDFVRRPEIAPKVAKMPS